MKLAFISDIHANLPALEAVLEDIKKQHPDDIYCLGDLVNFGCRDNEVIDLIRSLGITCVQGNHDEGIGYAQHNFGYSFSTEAQRRFGIESIKYVNRTITDLNRQFLKSLPFSIGLEFRFPFHKIRLAMVHGSPISNRDYVLEDTPDEQLLEMLEEIQTDILILGHTHRPFHRALFHEEENNKMYAHVINAGSVGKPKQGNNHACYVVLDIDNQTSLSDPAAFRAHFHYMPYDTEKVIDQIHASGLGDAYDDFLHSGETRQPFSRHKNF